MDANDPVYNLVHDERWRLLAVYRADDDNPKELFVPHQAGIDGAGGSSYINGVVLRQRDANSGWTSAGDGTLEERRYYCQNWRADLSAIVTSGGVMVEWAKFSAYGVPIGLPGGDTDSDGDCDATDEAAIHVWAVGYDVRYDFDLDGDVDGDDETLATSNVADAGWNVLSDPDLNANRVEYAGYQHDYNLDLNHVRNRVYSAELGRWTRRDPLGYVDGMSFYRYVHDRPTLGADPMGLWVDTTILMWHAAFIDGSKGVTIPGLSGTWLPEPMGWRAAGRWYCGTDNRTFQAHTTSTDRPSSRLWAMTQVATGQLDTLGEKDVLPPLDYGAGESKRAWRQYRYPAGLPGYMQLGVLGALFQDSVATSAVHGKATILSQSRCHIKFKLKLSAQYPHMPGIITPAIDLYAVWRVDVYGVDRAKIQWRWEHNLFPDHELITWGPNSPGNGDARDLYQAAAKGPGLVNLNFDAETVRGNSVYMPVYVPIECQNHKPIDDDL